MRLAHRRFLMIRCTVNPVVQKCSRAPCTGRTTGAAWCFVKNYECGPRREIDARAGRPLIHLKTPGPRSTIEHVGKNTRFSRRIESLRSL